MTLEMGQGNILDSDCDAIVIPVNTVGVMGKGLALAAAKKWPAMEARYKWWCQHQMLRPGGVRHWHAEPYQGPPTIVLFPTKRHWRETSRLDDIALGLMDLADWMASHQVQSIAIPALGCGLGQLAWSNVRPLIEAFPAAVPGARVVVWEPQ